MIVVVDVAVDVVVVVVVAVVVEFVAIHQHKTFMKIKHIVMVWDRMGYRTH